MTLLGSLGSAEISRRLSGAGLAWRTGPFHVRVRSPLAHLHRAVALLYAHHPLVADDAFCDHSMALLPGAGLRRWLRPQVRLQRDGLSLFEPMPVTHAVPLMEWAMNWCISSQAHQFLILHAAVLERDGAALVMPAPPGSGKSTLCTGLMFRGWRLLSDELTLIELDTGRIAPLVRPISLKNQSIDVIRRFAPQAVFSPPVHDTAKGTVAHLLVPPQHQAAVDVKAAPGWVIFPRWQAGAPVTMTPRQQADTLMELAANAFNDTVAGRDGFGVLCELVDRSQAFDFTYGDLDQAIAHLDHLVPRRTP